MLQRPCPMVAQWPGAAMAHQPVDEGTGGTWGPTHCYNPYFSVRCGATRGPCSATTLTFPSGLGEGHSSLLRKLVNMNPRLMGPQCNATPDPHMPTTICPAECHYCIRPTKNSFPHMEIPVSHLAKMLPVPCHSGTVTILCLK